MVLDEPPQQVDLWFASELSEEDGAHAIEVESESGDRVNDGKTVLDPADPTHVSTLLLPDLDDGRHTVRWRATAIDGFEVRGAYRFYVGTQPTSEQLAEDEALQAEAGAPDSSDGGGVNTAIIIGIVVALIAVLVAVIGFGIWGPRALE